MGKQLGGGNAGSALLTQAQANSIYIRTVNGNAPDGSGNVVTFTQGTGDARYVRTVNGTGPDGSGNVAVTAGVSSVAGRTGAIVLTEADVTNLTNDLNSIATELSGKADLSGGKLAAGQVPVNLVKTVNGTSPDGSGNVAVSAYATVDQVSHQFAPSGLVTDLLINQVMDMSMTRADGDSTDGSNEFTTSGGAFYVHEPIIPDATARVLSGGTRSSTTSAPDTANPSHNYHWVWLTPGEVQRGGMFINCAAGSWAAPGNGLPVGVFLQLPFADDTAPDGTHGVPRGAHFTLHIVNSTSYALRLWVNDDGGQGAGTPLSLPSGSNPVLYVVKLTFTPWTGWYIDSVQSMPYKAPWTLLGTQTSGTPRIPTYAFRGDTTTVQDYTVQNQNLWSTRQVTVLNAYNVTEWNGNAIYAPGLLAHEGGSGQTGPLTVDMSGNGVSVAFASGDQHPLSFLQAQTPSTWSGATATPFVTLHEAGHVMDVIMPRYNGTLSTYPNGFSNSAWWGTFWSTYISGESGGGAYAKTNQQEGWAEMYAAYTFFKSQSGGSTTYPYSTRYPAGTYLEYIINTGSGTTTDAAIQSYITWMDSNHQWS